MPLNYDNILLHSNIPALTQDSSGTITIAVSGTLAPSAINTFTGSATFISNAQLIRIYSQQDNVPTGMPYQYSVSSYIPAPPFGTANTPNMYLGCSVVGVPAATKIDIRLYPSLVNNVLTITISVNNPFTGNMTITPTNFTIRYISFLPSTT